MGRLNDYEIKLVKVQGEFVLHSHADTDEPFFVIAGELTIHLGQVTRAAGVSAKAVRLYEARGLLPPAERTAAGYRSFAAHAVDTVRFIRQARALGLSLDAAGEILAARQRGAPCGQASRLLTQRITEIDHTLRELRALRRSLVAARDSGHHAPRGNEVARLSRTQPPAHGEKGSPHRHP